MTGTVSDRVELPRHMERTAQSVSSRSLCYFTPLNLCSPLASASHVGSLVSGLVAGSVCEMTRVPVVFSLGGYLG